MHVIMDDIHISLRSNSGQTIPIMFLKLLASTNTSM